MDEHDRDEAQEIVRAIRQGEVDAFVVREAAEERIYSLRSADLLYRAMIEEMKDGAVAFDASGLVTYCNAYFAQMVRADRIIIIGARMFPFLPDDEWDFFALVADPPAEGARPRELAVRATDGTVVPVLAAMNRIRVDAQTELYCLILTDLTDQKHRDQVVVEGRRKDEFLAMLAHELRNPLAPIRYAAERLRGADVPPERVQWACEIIDRQVDQLTRLVDDLLDVSRITRGKLSLNVETLELEDVVARAVEAVRPMIDARRQEFRIPQPGTRLRLNGDAARLAQVISNLLHNAAKFTPEQGAIDLKVETEKDPSGADPAWVRIVVAETAPGFPPACCPRCSTCSSRPTRPRGGRSAGSALA